jgi:hypothetical protein
MHLGLRVVALFLFCLSATAAELKTRNVVLIISDGFRWQEVFGGADRELMTKGVKNTNALSRDFWRDTPEARREALLPFFWSEIARNGQLLGNQAKGSVVRVSNQKNFSYPGYNEIVSGIPDPRIDSNDKKLNPNTNVFEWINQQRGFRGKVSVLGSWNDFPWIFNVSRSHLPIWPAWDPQFVPWEIKVPTHIPAVLSDITPLWEDVILDGVLFHAVEQHFEKARPRLMFVGFGETDEWAHSGRYDMYLRAAHNMDDFVRRLWEAAQSRSQYRNKTTFIITADHGRGMGDEWTSHGEKIKGSEGDWLAVIGPDTPPRGERENTPAYAHSQIAATIAALLGEDFQKVSPQSGNSISELFQ